MNIMLGFDGGGNRDVLAFHAHVIWTIDEGGAATVVGEGYGKCHDKEQTNNVAEWSALMYGLMDVLPVIVTLKREHNIAKLFLHGDSQLVLRQLTGEYGITKPHLRYYYEKCRRLVERIEQEGVEVVTDWEGRDNNKAPDKLTHRARQRYLGKI